MKDQQVDGKQGLGNLTIDIKVLWLARSCRLRWINNLLAYLICTEENQGESYVE